MNASHNRIFELSINRTFEGGRNDHGKIILNNFRYEFFSFVMYIFLKKENHFKCFKQKNKNSV